MNSEAKRPRPRLLGLDALRGIAVVLMIEQHLGVWLWRGPNRGETIVDYPVLFGFNALGGGAAPAFVTLAGIGASLLASKRERPDATLAVRGLVVLGFGYLLSALTPSWFSWQSWFVLHLMGLGMLVTPLLRRLPTSALLAGALLILLATGWVQAILAVPPSLDNEYMAGRSALSPQRWTALRIAIAEGQFPVFPWFSFYLAGLACGRWIAQGDRLARIPALAGAALVVGLLGLSARAFVSAAPGSAIERTIALRVPFFPASPTLVALLLAAVLLGIWAVMAWDRRRPMDRRNPLVTLGRASLTLLIVHVWLFREAIRWVARTPERPQGLWQALEVGQAAGVLAGFLVLAGASAWLWQRIDYRYGAEWLLRKLAP
jgi:uncharacterized membrane protein